jgi:hypothetical protein
MQEIEAGRCRCCWWCPRTPSSVTAISWLITPSRPKNPFTNLHNSMQQANSAAAWKQPAIGCKHQDATEASSGSSKPPCVDGTHHQFSRLPSTEPYFNILTHQPFLRYIFSHICAGEWLCSLSISWPDLWFLFRKCLSIIWYIILCFSMFLHVSSPHLSIFVIHSTQLGLVFVEG